MSPERNLCEDADKNFSQRVAPAQPEFMIPKITI
jgi:hypothetical protein